MAHQADLPRVSLVAVLHPETILTLSDYRASQRTFHTLKQMIGFLRDNKKAEAVIQTALPYHFSIRFGAFQDYLSFYGQEIKFRRLMNYPPFSYIVEVLFQGENLRSIARQSREFSARVKRDDEDIEVLGPALASVARVRGRNRVQVILKGNIFYRIARLISCQLASKNQLASIYQYSKTYQRVNT